MTEEMIGIVFKDLDFANDCNRFVVIDKDQDDLLTCNQLGQIRRIGVDDLKQGRYRVTKTPVAPKYAYS